MVNKLWIFFILSGILFSLLTGNIDAINNEILLSSKKGFEMAIKMLPVMALWLGVMKIASNSGLLEIVSKKISPILKIIFPEIPKNHESLSLIATNVTANMLGLGNASTPFGLKAMKSLQEINKNKTQASNSMITFLVLNTSGLTIIPTTVISLRILHKSINPALIVIPTLIATSISTLTGLFFDYLFRRKK